MAIFRSQKGASSDGSPQREYADEKTIEDFHRTAAAAVELEGEHQAESTKLHRGLKARHITMIAIGGAIGTGLIIGTGSALAKAG